MRSPVSFPIFSCYGQNGLKLRGSVWPSTDETGRQAPAEGLLTSPLVHSTASVTGWGRGAGLILDLVVTRETHH